jgi:hypothetical protein
MLWQVLFGLKTNRNGWIPVLFVPQCVLTNVATLDKHLRNARVLATSFESGPQRVVMQESLPACKKMLLLIDR